MTLANDKIQVCYIHPTMVHAQFMQAFMEMLVWDISNPLGRLLTGKGGWAQVTSGPNVSLARNKLVENFLEKTEADWFLSIDTDMVFPPFAHRLLINAAKKTGAKVMGALYWGIEQTPATNGMPGNRLFPQAFMWPDGIESGLTHKLSPLPNEPVKVDGTGAGFLLIHREALQAVREAGFSKGFPWFQEEEFGGEVFSEDLVLCDRLAKVGYDIWIDPTLEVAHLKSTPLHTEFFKTLDFPGSKK